VGFPGKIGILAAGILHADVTSQTWLEWGRGRKPGRRLEELDHEDERSGLDFKFVKLNLVFFYDFLSPNPGSMRGDGSVEGYELGVYSVL
jgi:hypothetical protein